MQGKESDKDILCRDAIEYLITEGQLYTTIDEMVRSAICMGAMSEQR